MKKIALILALFISCTILNAQSIVGKWVTIDDETGKEKSHVEIYEKGGKYYGKIVHIVDPLKRTSKCRKCEGAKKNQPIVGMKIIEDLEKGVDDYEDGTILDPNKGKVYDCKMWLDESGDLQVRGYVAFFFRTQTWKKVK